MQGSNFDGIVGNTGIVTAFVALSRCWLLRWIWQHAASAENSRDKSAGGVCRWHDQGRL